MGADLEKFVIQVKIGNKWKTVEKPKDHLKAEHVSEKISQNLNKLGAEDVRILVGQLYPDSKNVKWTLYKKEKNIEKMKNRQISDKIININNESRIYNNKKYIYIVVTIIIFALLGLINKNNTSDEYDLAFSHYENGKYKEAYLELQQIVSDGDSRVFNLLGDMSYFGNGVDQDYNEAVKWYRKSAQKGNAEGQWLLGYMYFVGQGVDQNYNEAVKWYRKSAEQGNSDGQYGLGTAYFVGQGVDKNYNEAVKWYRKSAEQGNSDGQYGLGTAYRFGKGVDQNYNEALKWYRLAAEQGDVNAQEGIDQIVNRTMKTFNKPTKLKTYAPNFQYPSEVLGALQGVIEALAYQYSISTGNFQYAIGSVIEICKEYQIRVAKAKNRGDYHQGLGQAMWMGCRNNAQIYLK
ncbi:MAG: sel1 repeat family protein [Alphaproteobacteria bacterium]|nr:sel1 repeat family protein [Alphaproteobacteria bacterium]